MTRRSDSIVERGGSDGGERVKPWYESPRGLKKREHEKNFPRAFHFRVFPTIWEPGTGYFKFKCLAGKFYSYKHHQKICYGYFSLVTYIWYLLHICNRAFCAWVKALSNDRLRELTWNSKIMVTSCIAPLTSYKTSRHQTRTVGAGPDVTFEQAFDILFAILSPNREPVHMQASPDVVHSRPQSHSA